MPRRSRARKKPTDARTRARKPETRDKAEEAWRLRLRGHSLERIGQSLGGMVPSSVHELLAGYVGGRPIAGIEDYRQLLLARLDALYEEALTTLEGEESTKGRCDAIRTAKGILREQAIISGAVRQSPPVVMVNQFPHAPVLRRFSIEDIETIRVLQAKASAAVIDVEAQVVEVDRDQ